MPEKAIEDFLIANNFDSAGRVAKSSGMPEREHHIYAIGLEKYEKEAREARRDDSRKWNLGQAVHFAKLLGLDEKAVELLETGGMFDQAAKTAEAAGMHLVATRNWEKAGNFESAAASAGKAGDGGKAEAYRQVAELVKPREREHWFGNPQVF